MIIINIIDKTLILLNEKIKSEKPSFQDMKLLLCLEMTKLEILTTKKISNQTVGAYNEISAETYFAPYVAENSQINTNLKRIIMLLHNYNDEFDSYDIGIVGRTRESWGKYFSNTINQLFNNLIDE